MKLPRPSHPSTWGAIGIYVVLLLATLMEKFGKTTSDTKTPLIESPSSFLDGALSLWNPQLSLGELQNQAYGYLLPQGPYYLFADLIDLAPWISERIWSWLILVVGCEGARRLAKAMGMSPWAAWAVGMAYGLNPRTISQIGVRTGEILPAAVLPWVALPIVYALTARLGIRKAALFSAAAFMFAGAVNATATAAILPLVVVLIVWGVRRGLAGWSLLRWWAFFIGATSFWWAACLLVLRVYSPEFFDYVEDASDTTRTSGYTSSLRAASNWINYTFTGGNPSWPAGFKLAYEPWMVVASGLVAAVGVIGLATMRSPWRRPLLISACIGLVCLTVGHEATLGSPLSGAVQAQLDGLYALLRNIAKIDPVLRLPLAVGVGAAFGSLIERAATRRPARRDPRTWLPHVGVAVATGLVLSMAQPAIALNTRTPGWDEVPDYWHQTADYLAEQDDDGRAWIIPGSGFGVQTWGWTMDEPMSAVASTPWVTRSQVPLVPPETIRVLSRLEEFLASGAGSPNLGDTLARLGISHIVVRHDLDPTLAESTSTSLVSIAMARSEGVTREESFGEVDLGPAIEVFSVDTEAQPSVSVVPQSDTVTVGGAAADVVDAVGRGLIEPEQAAIVQGDSGWDEPADVVGDAFRLRERNFGRVHDAEGAVLSADEPRHSTRRVSNYPGNPGSTPLVSRYDGVEYVDASSSLAFTDGFGEVRPENAPFAAVDEDPDSGWRTGYFTDPVGQWIRVQLDEPRDLGTVEVTSTVSSPVVGDVLAWRISAGGVSKRFTVDALTGAAEVDMSGVVTDRLTLTVTKIDAARAQLPIEVRDIEFAGPAAERTMVMPPVTTSDSPDFVFTARPEVRTCITTLIAPDCDINRGRLSDESLGIDRTFEVAADGTFEVTGTVVARARPGTQGLLDPIGEPVVVRASSTLASDPTVSGRMVYDGAGSTSWISDPFDPAPTLTVEFDKPRTLSRIGVLQPAQPAVTPTRAILRAGDEERTVDLGDFGAFEPLRTDRVEIEFSNPTRGLSPIGMSQLYIGPGDITEPLDGATATGAVCGFGPNVELDGRRYTTRVEGFMGNVVSAGPLDMTLCEADGSDADVELSAGTHRLKVVSTEQFQPVITLLRSSGSRAAAPSEPRDLRVVSDEPSIQELELGPGEAAILRTTRNYNPGWVAELDGETLPVQRVDGWAQGWRIPEGRGGDLVIRYAPERPYITALFGGLAVAAALLLIAFVLLVRTRLAPGRQPEAQPRSRRRGPRSLAATVVGLAAAGALSWVFGGVPALAGLAVALVCWLTGARRTALVLAGLLLVAGPVWAGVALQLDDGPDQPVADLLTGAGFALAVGSAAVRSRRSTEAPGT